MINGPLSRCDECGWSQNDDMVYTCTECGTILSSPMQRCPECGYLPERHKYCKMCGERLYDEIDQEKPLLCDQCIQKVFDMMNDKRDPRLQETLNEGFVKIYVVQKDDSEDRWSREETDKLLRMLGYAHFVYIKLFHNHPFIIGKTGTRGSLKRDGTKKSSPVDFDFVVGDESDQRRSGDGRKWILKFFPEDQLMDHDFVLVKRAESELEALEIEQYYAEMWNLFQS